MPGSHMQQFQARMLELLEVADEAIDLNRKLVAELRNARDFQVDRAFELAGKAGLASEHPLYPAFQTLLKLIDDMLDRANSHISLKHIEILTREKTHFNDSRTRLNRKNRAAMAAIRSMQRETQAVDDTTTSTPTKSTDSGGDFSHVWKAFDTYPPKNFLTILDLQKIDPTITQGELDHLRDSAKILVSNIKTQEGLERYTTG